MVSCNVNVLVWLLTFDRIINREVEINTNNNVFLFSQTWGKNIHFIDE